MTLEEQIHQEASKQIEQIKEVYPNLGEDELRFIFICLRQCYTQGALDALNPK